MADGVVKVRVVMLFSVPVKDIEKLTEQGKKMMLADMKKRLEAAQSKVESIGVAA